MLHQEFRQIAHALRDSGRFNVLVILTLHANERNRCAPTQAQLADETGWSGKSVNDAIAWLEEHGAIERVPYNARAGDELTLPRRQIIYQLTGTLTLNGAVYHYLDTENS